MNIEAQRIKLAALVHIMATTKDSNLWAKCCHESGIIRDRLIEQRV